MTNQMTSDVFEYELNGVGEEPLAKDHIIINCIARKTSKVISYLFKFFFKFRIFDL
jgi:hypothetical protein